MAKSAGQRRVAIVLGLRTPFAKRASAYRALSALELGKIVVAELVQRAGLPSHHVQQVVYGQVLPSLPSLTARNIAREIVLGIGLPRSTEAFSVSSACATGYQSAVSVAQSIRAGVIECGIAGGADSASDAPMVASQRLRGALAKLGSGPLGAKVRAFSGLELTDLALSAPAPPEASPGITMVESAERLAKVNGISRSDQDAFAHRSHVLASQAWADGRLREEVMRVFVPPSYDAFGEDNRLRTDSELAAYERLAPSIDPRHGSVTAGNSAHLADGASALLLMSEKQAKKLGMGVLGYLRSYAFTAVDSNEQPLMGPAYATPLALKRAGLKLKHMDVIDMHEAFSAQVLSNVRALESDSFAQQKLGRGKRVGEVDWSKLNVSGGSIAFGHPIAATGARQVSQALRELRRRGGQYALCTACAAGGLAAAMVLEAE